MPYFALLDDAAANRAKLYQTHTGSRFFTAADLDGLDAALREGWQQGWHAVLFADYEFGLPLLGLPAQPPAHLALHWFERCTETNPETWFAQSCTDESPAGISTPANDTAEADYLQAVRDIQTAIARGDTYQINYTTRLHLTAYGNPIKLYRRLRQPVPYAALSRLPDHRGETRWTLCFSPELFLKIGSDGLITTEPMKGTAPILNDGQDEQRARDLQADPKNRAENIMIVDLLRNDLGKIAQTGRVRVPEPFKVSRFGSVWQMTTAIEAQAKPHIGAADIFRAAFPCGSITGAPKRMSMQIIRDIETAPRGLYTGSIGFLNPCGSGLGFSGTLNVVIRTLQLTPLSDGLYHGVYGVGSGIVADSVPADEYTECRWKARFLTDLAPEFGIFETMRVHQKQCPLLPLHLGRLKQSAAALNLPFADHIEQQIHGYLAQLPDHGLYRIKAVLNPSDGLSLSHAPLNELPPEQTVCLSATPLPPQDYLRRFKTTCRSIYDHGWQQAERQGAFDSLFFNSDGLLLEGGRSNIFIRLGNEWHTPALDLDILNGVMRQAVLADPQTHLGTDTVHQSRITREMFAQADEIRLSNALRGVFPVKIEKT
ncbi:MULTISPECIES: bifunctional chorismate-binding protein/class IV aminotransferase [unclassified Neisseria]|uniref:bifunctional chorismate-binding protein/class IV aminotransferase n=1 Tax=unclassified Neisseria TaxID=2623750 RepID=UPI002665E527|nr:MULTISPECIES: bifunctional anthranilate synthase component I family protein/class IV aminotransferase [unclassified Neisseria]MDO1509455.1 bifunctional anthranilate synthase component I family protein/class IV aminotransferase [Neisseria sp. MVDL19-042950]MDO1515772.1 bifunctional anthranilate synthase component I family protein/class IV aminotransferase [Neisseria sp. MVDL18-041461]MDO1563404.1 bifunctional anthranilate synthase component I family protein/class IV aminotransferase [Neisseria